MEQQTPERLTPIIGLDLHLYLDKDGYLVITNTERDDLTPLDKTQDFTIDAPLNGTVRADVRFIISEIDLSLPLDQVRMIAADEELDQLTVTRIKRWLHDQRKALQRAAESSKQNSEG